MSGRRTHPRSVRGTGTTGIAARNKGFDCVLIEQDDEMQAIIERRLAETS